MDTTNTTTNTGREAEGDAMSNASIHTQVIDNVDDWFSTRIDYATFCVRQRAILLAAEKVGVECEALIRLRRKFAAGVYGETA